jgi:hypothetical protein
MLWFPPVRSRVGLGEDPSDCLRGSKRAHKAHNKNKKILRAMGRPIRIERLIQVFLYVENLAKRRKYPVRISAYMI